MTDPGREPSPAPRPAWWRWFLRPWNVVFLALWIYIVVQLAPHMAAVVGIDTGAGVTPVYTFELLNGEVVSSTSLRGRVVLVNFWATWCPPCKVEMPLLQSMAERHAESGLVVLGLSRDRGSADAVRAFLVERDITYPVAIVGPDAERVFGGVRGYPTSFLVDRNGRIRHAALGPLAMVSFEPAVRRLLAEAADGP